MKFRKKPVVIEATQWFKNGDHPEDGEEMIVVGDDAPFRAEGKVVRYFRRPEPEYAGSTAHDGCGRTWHDHGWIDTLEGGHTVCPGDWIITGVKGERYPCKPGIFVATYESVADAKGGNMNTEEHDVLFVASRGWSADFAPDGVSVPPHVKRTWVDGQGRRCAFGPRGAFCLQTYEEAVELAALLNEFVGLAKSMA